MSDRPPTYDELVRANAALAEDNARLRSSLGSMQSRVVAQDAEIARLAAPKRQPRKLDPAAKDAFARPLRR